jgi:hypothetical protein
VTAGVLDEYGITARPGTLRRDRCWDAVRAAVETAVELAAPVYRPAFEDGEIRTDLHLRPGRGHASGRSRAPGTGSDRARRRDLAQFAEAGHHVANDNTDIGNTPMAATFTRCHYNVIGHRIVFT